MSLARAVVRAASRSALPRAAGIRFMAEEHQFNKNKETAEERNFITRSEQDLLKNLLKKVKAQTDPTAQQDKEALALILKRHNVTATPNLVDDLIKWSHH